MRIRKIVARTLLAAVPLVVGGGAALLFWLPDLVRDRVVSEALARTGLQTSVGSAQVHASSIVLSQLTIGDEEDGPSIVARRVVVEAGLLELVARGASAIDAISLEGVRIALPLEDSRTQSLLERLRPSSSPDAPAPTSEGEQRARVLPAVRVRDLELEASDETGPLVSCRLPSASVDKGAAHAEIEHLVMGGAPSARVDLKGVALHAERGAQGVRLKSAQVRSAKVVLPSTDADGQPPRLASRVRRLLGGARGAAASQASASQAAPSKESAPAWRRLSEGAEVTLKSGAVSVAGEDVPVLAEVSGTLRAKGPGVVGLSGSGKARGGGSMSWDLRLRLEQLEADGTLELRSLPLSLVAPLLPEVPWHRPADARIDAALVIQTESVQRVRLSGEASLRDAALDSPRIATTPVTGINVNLSGKGHWLPLDKRLELEQAQVTLGEATAVLEGAIEWSPDHYLFDVDARLEDTPCTKAVRSIPQNLLGEMALASWQGKIGGRIRLHLDSRDFGTAVLDIEVDDRCEFVEVPAMADLRRFRMPFVHSVLEPDGSRFEMETGPGTPAWTYLEDISPFMVHAVLAHEDAGFFSHSGFSPHHIRNALVRNLREGRYVVGASTITMQLVKNIFLHREKTLARKIQEVLLTWWIERVMDKSEILELYLNVIEYGPGVYGIRNGARHYFNRLPSQLSPAEAVYLSTILPNPKRYHSHFERGSLSPGWADRMRKIFARMRAREWYSPDAVDYGLSELGRFRFVPEGTLTEARQIPGTTALLPYMRSYEGNGDWDLVEEPQGELPPAPAQTAPPSG